MAGVVFINGSSPCLFRIVRSGPDSVSDRIQLNKNCQTNNIHWNPLSRKFKALTSQIKTTVVASVVITNQILFLDNSHAI